MQSSQPGGERTGDDTFRPYRRLAVSVLARAFLDLQDTRHSAAEDRESARLFLTGSGMLAHWCHVAALDPGSIAGRARELTRRQRCRSSPGLPDAFAHRLGDIVP